MQPLANALAADPNEPETRYPLRAYVCERCWLMQVPPAATPEQVFGGDYPFRSGASPGWARHCAELARMAVDTLSLDRSSRVLDVGSNDGTLLRAFRVAGVLNVLGFEPSKACLAADALDVPTVQDFFTRATVDEWGIAESADLLVATNVLAHTPDPDDMIAAIAATLKPGGTAIIEFPWVLDLLQHYQFDTIYHEHYSYFSLLALQPMLARHGLSIHHVERLPVHGGSLRLWCGKKQRATSMAVHEAVHAESTAKLSDRWIYDRLRGQARRIRRDLVQFLWNAADDGDAVGGYGAPAKGNTLLNYCGVGTDLLPFVVDTTPAKQGLWLPGSRVPVLHPDELQARKSHYVLILPWNWAAEIKPRLDYIRAWGGQFVTAAPFLEIQ